MIIVIFYFQRKNFLSMEVEKVNMHLYESLSFKLGLSDQNSLSPEFLSAVSR